MIAYTDGSCLSNPGRGGWAYVLLDGDHIIKSDSGGEKYTTNNRMEMLAAINAVIAGARIVRTDSTYVINGITKWVAGWIKAGWKKPNKAAVRNADLWQQLLAISAGVVWEHVRGHSGDKYNDMVDVAARKVASSM